MSTPRQRCAQCGQFLSESAVHVRLRYGSATPAVHARCFGAWVTALATTPAQQHLYPHRMGFGAARDYAMRICGGFTTSTQCGVLGDLFRTMPGLPAPTIHEEGNVVMVLTWHDTKATPSVPARLAFTRADGRTHYLVGNGYVFADDLRNALDECCLSWLGRLFWRA
jgi:hypothetical protein